MNTTLKTILATNQVIGPDGSRLPLHSGISPKACQLMQAWIAEHGPKRLLEIGLAYGVSSLFICDAIADWQDVGYHIIDPFQHRDWQSIGLRNLDQAGFEIGRAHV